LAVVENKIIPKYFEMIEVFEELLVTSDHNAGIWRLPQGEDIYRAALRSNNSTNLTADEIHNIGLSEVARIEQEMEVILINQGLVDDSIVSRIRYLMELPEHNFSNTDEGESPADRLSQ